MNDATDPNSVEQRLKAIAIDIANVNRRLAGVDVHLDEMHRLIEQVGRELNDRLSKLGI